MRNRITLTLFAILGGLMRCSAALCQTGTYLDELRAPSSPAYALLGGTPKSVDRPTTPATLEAAMTSIAGPNGITPGTGIEVVPYWYWRHPDLSYKEYMNPDPGVNSAWQTLALSVASGKPSFAQDTSSTAIAYGIRFQLVKGALSADYQSYFSKVYMQKIFEAEAFINRLKVPYAALFSDLISEGPHLKSTVELRDYVDTSQEFRNRLATRARAAELKQELEENPDLSALLQPVITTIIRCIDTGIAGNDTLQQRVEFESSDTRSLGAFVKDALIVAEDSALARGNITKILDSLKTLSSERVGLAIELDGAGLTEFVNNVYDRSIFAKGGVWMTAGYAAPGGYDISACAKYLYNSPRLDSSSDFETGVSLGYHTADFSIAAEAIYLSSKDSLNSFGSGLRYVSSWKWDGSVNYRFNEQISATGTFGKDFKDTKTKSQGAIALLGINFSLGQLSNLLRNVAQ